MKISVFDMLKIGLGPSSSHTVGPMVASNMFIKSLQQQNIIGYQKINNLKIELFGSLAHTGKGHGTDKAVLLGLEGHEPSTIDTKLINEMFQWIKQEKSLYLNHQVTLDFAYDSDLIFNKKKNLPYHSNALTIDALDKNHNSLYKMDYYSIGGGFVESGEDLKAKQSSVTPWDTNPYKFKFDSAKELQSLCQSTGLDIKQIMMENELTQWNQQEIDTKLDLIWKTMDAAINEGLAGEGYLPGPLKYKWEAADLYLKIKSQKNSLLNTLDYLQLYAIATSEYNAVGGRIVTAPTNGAAGIIPAVLKFLKEFYKDQLGETFHRDYYLVASAIGVLIKKNASISGAEGGCQAEVGSACSMAAAGMTYVLGGNTEQIFNAAKIALEGNLGMTCDPIFGLVQIPCIKRNSLASIKAISAANLALKSESLDPISFDRVVRVLKKTGDDMKKEYKETALGGLAHDFQEFQEDGTKRSKKEKKVFEIQMSDY